MATFHFTWRVQLGMVTLLLVHFEGGASVRNNDGLLPLHFAVVSGALDIVERLLLAFPAGTAVMDNDGNLPLHFASSLEGPLGRAMIDLLLNEDEDVLVDNIKRMNLSSHNANSVGANNVSGSPGSECFIPSGLVKNADQNTPLMVAIQALSGWEVIEALLDGRGGESAVVEYDDTGNNPLHHVVCGNCADPAACLSLLKRVPRSVALPNKDGIMPIELACMEMMPREVILALVLVDLPFDLDERGELSDLKDGYGFSWRYIACDCDDEHVGIVQEVLSMCSYHQTRELCFIRGGGTSSGGSVISRATPKVKDRLRRALRFVGRYEFIGGDALYTDQSLGIKVFEAMDFGTGENPLVNPQRVILRCYSDQESCFRDTAHVREVKFDSSLIETATYFCVHDFEAYSSANMPRQYCVAVERPNLTLSRVVAEISRDGLDKEVQMRILTKVSMVLRLIGRCIRYIHSKNIIHGGISIHTSGKFGDVWKIMGATGLTTNGSDLHHSRVGSTCLPPEYVQIDRRGDPSFKRILIAHQSVDVWAYGKLMYEVLTGNELIEFEEEMEPQDDKKALYKLARWNEEELRRISIDLSIAGVSSAGVELVRLCLAPDRMYRPSMVDVLQHTYWFTLKRNKSRTNRRTTASPSVSTVP
eukprot:CAMPEP_0116043830 /NCGR_PEP_ID=MMETSP0321-20121206/26644_1 /TAXON_ID=163516 /ORGANISM="Leptocylindrus danicus var. danicus, Strain B650" /LENGTH=645 /DNA_ID=CAMNT_0003524823 /DNA_START=138 /DNA_END=2072 /DNA_ORIENTATION=+